MLDPCTVIFSHAFRLPPGPTGLLFLGVVNKLDPLQVRQKLQEWKDQYGDIYSFTLPGQHVVVVSEGQAHVISAQLAFLPHHCLPTQGMLLYIRTHCYWSVVHTTVLSFSELNSMESAELVEYHF